MDLVCLDNVDAVAGRDAWEHALFVLYNRLRDRGARLLASAHQPPPDLPLRLADLRSRLSWGPVFRLRALSDDARLELLQRSAAARGMELSATAGRYILNHCARDLHSLQALLDRLDDASLAAQRKPSIAMIQRIVDAEAAS
jgi:DnaA family protein